MSWTKPTIGAAVGATLGVGLAVAAPIVILPVIGFGANGVAAGSVAAMAHSLIGNVAAGSTFALFQSAGAVGAVSATTTGLATAAGTAAGATAGVAPSLISRWWRVSWLNNVIELLLGRYKCAGFSSVS